MNQTTISGIATPSFIEDMRHIILRDVAVLLDELEQIPEELLWETLPGVQNSAGTLILHLCGNLRHFIGAVLASDGYKRDRDAEFSGAHHSKKEVAHAIRISLLALEHAFDKLTIDHLNSEMPDTPPHHRGRSVGFFSDTTINSFVEAHRAA